MVSLPTDQNHPRAWDLDNRTDIIRYATKECERRCICSKEEQAKRRRACQTFNLSWRFEDYYDTIIVKNETLCSIYNAFARYPRRYETGQGANWAKEENYEVKEVLIISGPYSADTLYFSRFTKIPDSDMDSILEEHGGVDAIKAIIAREIRDHKPNHHPKQVHSILDRGEVYEYDTISSHLIVECIPPAFVLTSCSSWELGSLSSLIFEVHETLKKDDNRVDCYTLQYALRNLGVKCESHLEIKRYVWRAKKNLYHLVSKASYPEGLALCYSTRLRIFFENISASMAFELLPCGEILHVEPDLKEEIRPEMFHYAGYEESYVYNKLLDFDSDNDSVFSISGHSGESLNLSSKTSSVQSTLRKRRD
ncbi:hypothetical protein NCAS_0I02590 [Naumovozyma castellii]|uniref:Uncharacterized protein n=1 Tax=Naumovozyma castellii TaxID=27288 RepID=G0VK93_NAUCA|nr:hypothetical protein NCAS_0I02590 [Naumovozyma castellii CBS 4309]CCC71927.1 hypothetical protein NCAS_0I02590 [Naumovozyma castellii CBS 4309]